MIALNVFRIACAHKIQRSCGRPEGSQAHPRDYSHKCYRQRKLLYGYQTTHVDLGRSKSEERQGFPDQMFGNWMSAHRARTVALQKRCGVT